MDEEPSPPRRRTRSARRTVRACAVLAAVLLAGAGMNLWTQRITAWERRLGLLDEWVFPQGKDTLTRQISLLGLGGLRTLSAELLALDAVDAWSRHDWNQVETRYRQIVTLCPKQENYWTAAARHMYYNAASDALADESLDAWEKKATAKRYMDSGLKFLQDGAAINPQSAALHARQGDFLSDLNRSPHFGRAAQAYHRAVELGASPIYRRMEFYALCRTPGKEREAWKLGRELFENPSHRLPSLLGALCALQNKLKIPAGERLSPEALFGSRERARRYLTQYARNTLRFPTDGIGETLRQLDGE